MNFTNAYKSSVCQQIGILRKIRRTRDARPHRDPLLRCYSYARPKIFKEEQDGTRHDETNELSAYAFLFVVFCFPTGALAKLEFDGQK